MLVRVALPVLAGLVDGPASGLAMLAVQEGGLHLARRLFARDRLFAERLFLGALALRALLAGGLHVALTAMRGSGYLVEDAYTYDVLGAWLARIAAGEPLSIYEGHQHALATAYPHLLAALYGLLGYAPLVPKVLNSGAGALAAVIVGEVAARAYGGRVGRRASLAMAGLPSLVLWSTMTLRDPLILLGIALGLYGLQTLLSARPAPDERANSLVALAAALLLVWDLRQPAAVILLGLALVALALALTRRVGIRFVVATCLALVLAGGALLAVVRDRNPEGRLARATQPYEIARLLTERRLSLGGPEWLKEQAAGASAADPGAPTGESVSVSLADWAAWTAQAAFSPAPWQVRSNREAPAAAEMLLWYGLMLGAMASLPLRSREPDFPRLLWLHVLATWLLITLSEGVVGNLLRHRVMLAPSLVLLGVAGLTRVWDARSSWQRQHEPRGATRPGPRQARRTAEPAVDHPRGAGSAPRPG